MSSDERDYPCSGAPVDNSRSIAKENSAAHQEWHDAEWFFQWERIARERPATHDQ